MEWRGLSPAEEIVRDLGALAPEATWVQGLKAHSTLRPEAAGLKPRPSEGHEYYRLLMQRGTRQNQPAETIDGMCGDAKLAGPGRSSAPISPGCAR